MDWTKGGREVKVSFVLTGNLRGGEEGGGDVKDISSNVLAVWTDSKSHLSCPASPASLWPVL